MSSVDFFPSPCCIAEAVAFVVFYFFIFLHRVHHTSLMFYDSKADRVFIGRAIFSPSLAALFIRIKLHFRTYLSICSKMNLLRCFEILRLSWIKASPVIS